MAIAASLIETTIYTLAGHDERCLIAPADGSHIVLFIPPLFDEANKMRHAMVQTMHALVQRHAVSAILPDLPGTLESQRPLSKICLTDWQTALSDIIAQHGGVTHIAAFRAGCGIIGNIDNLPQWHLAPANGWRQIRTLARAQLASEREAGHTPRSLTDMTNDLLQNGAHLAGYNISAKMAAGLEAGANPVPAHRVQLIGDDKPADSQINGSPLWLRNEPSHDENMAQAMAENMARWIAS
jgi:hypothetical protein